MSHNTSAAKVETNYFKKIKTIEWYMHHGIPKVYRYIPSHTPFLYGAIQPSSQRNYEERFVGHYVQCE